jgi:hypothetical protein
MIVYLRNRGHHISEETRAKISKAMIGNQHLLAHKHTKEQDEKFRKSMVGKHWKWGRRENS